MGDDKRTKIIEAAATTFAQKGFAPTKIAEIAKTAGVGKGTVYEYFSSKQTLLEEVFVYFFSSLEHQMQTPQGNPFEQLCHMIHTSLSSVTQMGDLVLLTIDFWAASFKDRSSRIFSLIENMYHNYLDQITALIEAGQQSGIFKKTIESKYFAMILFSMIDEFFLHLAIFKEKIEIEKFEQECIELCKFRLLKNPMEA